MTANYQDMVDMLKQAADNQHTLLAAINNNSASQIYMGKITNLTSTTNCYNIVDELFHLHMYHKTVKIYRIVLKLKTCTITVLQSCNEQEKPILLLAILE